MFDSENNGTIPQQDFNTAIEVCCRDPRLARFYRSAPQGAKRFIAMQFYARVFAARLDQDTYGRYLSEIGYGLTAIDLDYLLLEETDESMRTYLQGLRTRLSPEAGAQGAAAAPARASKLKRVEDVRREMLENEAFGDEVAEMDAVPSGAGWSSVVTKASYAALILFAAVAAWWFLSGRNAKGPASDGQSKLSPEARALFEERINAVEALIVKEGQEKADLPRLQAAEIKAVKDEHEMLLAPLKKQQDELTALIEERTKQVEALVAQSDRLTRDGESMIAKLTARIEAVGGKGNRPRGNAAQVVDKACTKCKGAGQVMETRTCPTCGGTGHSSRVRYYDDRFGYYRVRYQNDGNCANCRGSGRIKVKNPCFQCDGRGRIPLDQ